jgi:hypothetical protein
VNSKSLGSTGKECALGNFYTNTALYPSDADAVVNAVTQAKREAFVSPTRDGVTIVYDAASEDQDEDELSRAASDLSRNLQCAALAVLNHDDDILWYRLFANGFPQDEYDSTPGYFDDAEPSSPRGGNAELLARAFNHPAGSGAISEVLKRSALEKGGYTFALDRHRDLAALLGIRFELACLGFNYLAEGDLPEGISREEFRHVGAA